MILVRDDRVDSALRQDRKTACRNRTRAASRRSERRSFDRRIHNERANQCQSRTIFEIRESEATAQIRAVFAGPLEDHQSPPPATILFLVICAGLEPFFDCLARAPLVSLKGRALQRPFFVPARRQPLGQKIRQHLHTRRARAARRHHQMHGAFLLLPAFQDDLELSDAIASPTMNSGRSAMPSPASSAGMIASPLLPRSCPVGRTRTSSPAALV